MSQTTHSHPAPGASPTRRQVIQAAAVASAAAFTASMGLTGAYAAGSDKLRVGMIGCGRRGRGAAEDCVRSSENVEFVALGDLFKDNLDGAYNDLRKLGDKFKVTPERCFVGFDAYKKVLATDIDLVLLTAPPGFRYLHLKAAVDAGKNVFMEKPVAVCPTSARSILATSELAASKKLAIVAGTQRRHQFHYVETMKRILDGQIGQITSAEAYWLGDYGYYPAVHKNPRWTDMEWQIRNWNYFAWLSGDIIVEQHVHNLDVIRWAMGNPVKCIATGSRAVRTGPEFGHIYDNFNVSYEFPNGANVLSMCRQMSGTAQRVSERFAGTKGWASGHGRIGGEKPWQYEGAHPNPYVQEHTDLIKSIRDGKPLNEGKEIAYSSLMAVMGRISAYTGREVSWDWVLKASKLDLTPARYEFGDMPVPPVAVPGQTSLV